MALFVVAPEANTVPFGSRGIGPNSNEEGSTRFTTVLLVGSGPSAGGGIIDLITHLATAAGNVGIDGENLAAGQHRPAFFIVIVEFAGAGCGPSRGRSS